MPQFNSIKLNLTSSGISHSGIVPPLKDGVFPTKLIHHHYTKQMLAALPRPSSRRRRLGLSANDQTLVAAPPCIQSNDPVLSFEDVAVQYRRGNREVFNAVKGVTLDLKRGEIFGLVGESSSGKSTLAKTAVGLATASQGKVSRTGEVLNWAEAKMAWRRDVQYIFHDPRGALAPA